MMRNILQMFAHIGEHYKMVATNHPGVFNKALNVWNMDETAVTGKTGRKLRVSSASNSHHGCARVELPLGNDLHVTAVIITSADGEKLSPLFIITGKYIMERWFQPLPAQRFTENGNTHCLAEKEWILRDSVVVSTENGSMEKSTTHIFIEHMHRFFRIVTPFPKTLVLLLN